MKVRLILDLEVSASNAAEAREEVWQAIVKDAMVYHLTQAMEWHGKAPPEGVVSEEGVRRWNINTEHLTAYHKTWADVIDTAAYEITVEPSL